MGFSAGLMIRNFHQLYKSGLVFDTEAIRKPS